MFLQIGVDQKCLTIHDASRQIDWQTSPYASIERDLTLKIDFRECIQEFAEMRAKKLKFDHWFIDTTLKNDFFFIFGGSAVGCVWRLRCWCLH